MEDIVENPNLVLAEWTNCSSESQICSWFGVKCNNASYRVVELDLSGCSLAGTISSSLASLAYLTVLDLSRKLLRGPNSVRPWLSAAGRVLSGAGKLVSSVVIGSDSSSSESGWGSSECWFDLAWCKSKVEYGVTWQLFSCLKLLPLLPIFS
uniref:Leucine-rich repeat-containing N-terminal plant-type domain-containing protein n=1 Tax=Kalanchoe fedtschenkoi TaxID=63787 RepID=A0A7N0T364_KALFE